MKRLHQLKEKVMNGQLLQKAEALELMEQPLEPLCQAANEIRDLFCGNQFDLCTIINGKSGKCSENCKFCAQSICYETKVEEYKLLPLEEIMEQAKYNTERGVFRYSIVTSGKKLNEKEVEQMCDVIKKIKTETGVTVCASFGLLEEEQFQKIKQAGVNRIHNNLETSENYFKEVCTTHSYTDKINTIKEAKKEGLDICSGGIMGMGETMEDRIDMVLAVRELGVRSIPVNMLNPISGTPYEKRDKLTVEEMCRTVAIFRFLVPDAFIRLAGGRGLLPDKGRKCFLSGANAAITGDMLTTAGISIEQDMKLIKELGYIAI